MVGCKVVLGLSGESKGWQGNQVLTGGPGGAREVQGVQGVPMRSRGRQWYHGCQGCQGASGGLASYNTVSPEAVIRTLGGGGQRGINAGQGSAG